MLLYSESSEVPASRERTVPVIATENLVKRFGAIQALAGVTLTVERGQIFGLLGQNGAGKTTLIKILLGVTKKTEGRALLLDQPAGAASARRRVGYLPEDHRFPDYHTGASLLDFYGALLDVPGRVRRKRIPEILEVVGLKGRMHYKIRTYSKGMKQRLGIAQALMHQPDVIFLDEPTDGVDPVGRREIRDIMQSLKAEGKTIFLNSHLLSEVEQICDRVAILAKGELVREGDIAALTKVQGFFLIGLAPGEAFPAEEAAKLGYTGRFMGAFYEVALTDGQSIDPIVALLHERGLKLRHLVQKRQTLEDLFVQTVASAEPGVDHRPGGRRAVERPPRTSASRASQPTPCGVETLSHEIPGHSQGLLPGGHRRQGLLRHGRPVAAADPGGLAPSRSRRPPAASRPRCNYAAVPLNLDADRRGGDAPGDHPEAFTRSVTDPGGRREAARRQRARSTTRPRRPSSFRRPVASASSRPRTSLPKDAENNPEDPAEAIDHIRQRFGA